MTTINSLYTAEEIANQLKDAGATWLFTVSALLPGAEAAAQEVERERAHPVELLMGDDTGEEAVPAQAGDRGECIEDQCLLTAGEPEPGPRKAAGMPMLKTQTGRCANRARWRCTRAAASGSHCRLWTALPRTKAE